MKGDRPGLRFPALLAILLSGISPLVAMPAPGQGSVTEDLSKGRTFTFTIAPQLPVFRFKLIPNVQPDDQYGNARSTIREIEVYAGDSAKPLQMLTGCDLREAGPPFKGSNFFLARDMNFDGYKDIFLVTGQGATGNRSGCAWIYDPKANRFEYNDAFSQLDRFWLEPATHTIFTFANGGQVGFVHTAQRYKVEGNSLQLIWSENQDWDNATSRFHCIVKERRGGAMTVVRDTWTQPNSDDGACDPGVLFRNLPKRE